MSGTIVSVESTDGTFTQRVTAGDHVWLADEPVSLGGEDKGPTPYDMLLAALGSCTAITLEMYAKRKDWQLTRVHVGLEHSREYREDCAKCEGGKGQIEVIDRVITLEGELDDEQRERLMQIADKCPVHKTLTGVIEINTLPGE